MSQKTAIDLGVARVSTSSHVPRHPVNARALRRGVAQLWDPPVDRLRHAAQLVRVGLALLAQPAVRQPLVEGLRLARVAAPDGLAHAATPARGVLLSSCPPILCSTLLGWHWLRCTRVVPSTLPAVMLLRRTPSCGLHLMPLPLGHAVDY